jgi:hypothetical protein
VGEGLGITTGVGLGIGAGVGDEIGVGEGLGDGLGNDCITEEPSVAALLKLTFAQF